VKRIQSIDDLTPDSKNANLGTERGRGMLEQSLREFGAGRSILVDKQGVVIAGNKTLEIAEQLGLPVRVVTTNGGELVVVQRRDLDLDDGDQARRLAYMDNRSSQVGLDWDAAQILADLETDVDLGGLWADAEIAELVAGVIEEPPEDPGPQIDRAEELREKWGVERGQIWSIDKHRLMCGDSTNEEEVIQLLGQMMPMLMVTDPPYGVAYDPAWRQRAAAEGHLAYAARRIGKVHADDQVDWGSAWALFPGDVVYCWHADRYASRVQDSLEATGFEIRCQIIWSKSNYPISRGHYHWRHEPCWYGVRRGATAHWIGDRKQTTVWEINLDRNVEGGHSTQKPLECMAKPIRNHEGDVYDPFLGSGTTMVAAEQTGRICYGMEIEPKYVAVTLQRLVDMGLEPRLVEAGT